MSKINFILGNDSLTVFFKGKPYTINKQAHTFETVLKAVRAGDEKALQAALEIRNTIVSAIASKAGGAVRIEGSQIFYGDREVTGLIASRIFEVIRLGLDVQPMVRFLENLLSNPSKRAVDELFGFLDACKLPITDDGHFLAYKRVRSNYFDVHSGSMDNSVGNVLEMPRNLVDEDKNRTCSAGLHFCSYGYLSSFGGDRIMILKINPADVVAIPADYNNSKGRTCKYEVVDELPLDEYSKLPSTPITDDYSPAYGKKGGWDEPEVAAALDEEEEGSDWEESWEESWEDSEASLEEEVESLSSDEVEDIVELYKAGDFTKEQIASDFVISEEALELLASNHGLTFASDKRDSSNTTGKLTPNDVLQIRRLLNKGDSLAQIARAYGVHPRSIARIRDGEAWSNI